MTLRHRVRPTKLALAAIAMIAGAASGQRPAVLALPDGGTVEVLGLRRWTIAMLQDSLAKYAPHDSLQSHACAAVLRYKLGFADAASTGYVFEQSSPTRIVVSVREPQDSARVHYRAMPLDTVNARPEWRLATDLIARRPDLFWQAARAHLSAPSSAPGMGLFRSAADSSAAAAIVDFLAARVTERDRREALGVLASDPNLYDRAVATVILGNFGARDDTWWTLVDALREREGIVKQFAGQVLGTLSQRAPRRVQWAPAASAINAVLDGTSLFELPALIGVLVRTGVGPADARPFLGGGGDMLLAYLGSSTPALSGPSHQLLVQLRGADLGTDAAPWRSWIDGL